MDWLTFLGLLLSELVPVAQSLALGVAGSLTASGLQALLAQARAAHRRGQLTPELLAQAIRDHLPAISEQLQANWMRIFEVRLDVEDVLRRLGPITEALDRLQTLQGVDHGLAKLLALKFHELCDGLTPLAAQHDEQLRLLQDLRTRFSLSLPARFTVVRDLDAPDSFGRLLRVLDLHPEHVYLDSLVQRPDLLRQARPAANTLITGLPGAGKTTLMHQVLLRDRPEAAVVVREGFGSHPDDLRWLMADDLPAAFTLVYDNVQVHPQAFRDALLALRQFRPGVRILCVCRSTDLERVEREITGFRETLHIGCEVCVPALTRAQAAGVVALCERCWGIQIEEGLREWLLDRVGQAYATPFYFISLLAPVRAKPDHTARLADVIALPEDAQQSVLSMWGEYFRRLDPRCRDLLRAIRMVHDMEVETDLPMVSLIAEGVFGRSDTEQREAREGLSEVLWVSVAQGRYSCYDTQLEAVTIPEEDHDRFVSWVLGLPGPPDLRRLVLCQGGLVEYRRALRLRDGAARARALASVATLWETGANEYTGPAFLTERAAFLSNASNCHAELAAVAETIEERRSHHRRAGECVEEAVSLHRRLNLPADLAQSLINASSLYATLARAAASDEERRAHLQRAVPMIEEAIVIAWRLSLAGNLVGALNNASNLYAELAAAQSEEQRRETLRRSAASIEEAVRLSRALNLPGELASSLNNEARCRAALAAAAGCRPDRLDQLHRGVLSIQEAVALYRRLDLPAELAATLTNESNLHAAIATEAQASEEIRDQLRLAVACVEEAVGLYRQLNLAADLAGSLTSASNRYRELAKVAAECGEEWWQVLRLSVVRCEEAVAIYRRLELLAELAGSMINLSNLYTVVPARNLQEQRGQLRRALTIIGDAVDLYRRLNLPAELGMSLGTSATTWETMVELAEDPVTTRQCQEHAAAAIDEAIALFERTGQAFWLVRAYPHGIEVHLPLVAVRPESRMKAREYARKAIPLLRAYDQEAQARGMEELLKHLGEEGDG